MCKIKFKSFRMNVVVPDLSKKNYLRKNVPFKKFKSLRSHKNKTKNCQKLRLNFSRFFLLKKNTPKRVAEKGIWDFRNYQN